MQKIDVSSLNYLDLIPDPIYQRLVTHQYRSTGHNKVKSLQQRAIGVLEIRQQLLMGKAVSRDSLLRWLDTNLVEVFYQQLNERELLKNTFDNESYTDDILLHVLNWLDKIDDKVKAEKSSYVTDNDINKTSLQTRIENNTSASDAAKLHQSMQEVNKGFALERHLGWELSKGVQYHSDLKILISTHREIKKSKRIQLIIDLIGRDKTELFDQKKLKGLNQTVYEVDKLEKKLPTENAVNSVTGVYYGDDISKMLASELALLGNEKLKMLWHARRAEHQLLSYHYKGLLSDRVPNIQAESIDFKVAGKHRLKVKGPMILCVDTSASMKGRPEMLSKAIALEAMRMTHLQKRACYVFCFGGENEMLELNLSLDIGWQSILDFIKLSFNGGTDINTALKCALEKQGLKQFNNADILLISDGRFEIEEALINKIRNKNFTMKIFGLQLAKWNLSAFNDICHEVIDLSNA